MKNLNGRINELVRDLCQIVPMPKSLVRKNIRDIVETALRECRPEEQKSKHIDIIQQNEGYNQCLSDYDTNCKNYLK